MKERNRFAFKEWAAVCEALDGGLQSLILRKGGISEGTSGFRVEHSEFWLYPTEFHQQPDVLIPEARPLLDRVNATAPSDGTILIRNYVVVEQVIEVLDETKLQRLAGLHIWSDATLKSRFHYRTPMLFALIVRVYRSEVRVVIPASPEFAGCRSWVELHNEVQTNGLKAVIADDVHLEHVTRIRKSLELE